MPDKALQPTPARRSCVGRFLSHGFAARFTHYAENRNLKPAAELDVGYR
jgi:hypothetical protein